MATSFGEIMCTQFYSKSSVSYTIGSAFLVAIQRYMAHLIWRKIDQDVVGQIFGGFEFTAWTMLLEQHWHENQEILCGNRL
jgi:hypothetical protein